MLCLDWDPYLSFSGFYYSRQVPELPFNLDSSDKKVGLHLRVVGIVALAHTNCPDIISFVILIIEETLELQKQSTQNLRMETLKPALTGGSVWLILQVGFSVKSSHLPRVALQLMSCGVGTGAGYLCS